MEKKSMALTLIIITLLALSSAILTKGYIPQYNAQDKVATIRDAVTFTTQTGYIVRLADLEASNSSNVSSLQAIIPHNTTVYLDIINQTMANNSVLLTSVVYVEHNSTHFENVNKLLLGSTAYFFLIQREDNITPYSWETYIADNLLANNTLGFDFSNFDELRIALISTYSSQTLTHAGYLISTVIGIVTLFWTFFYKDQDIRDFHKKSLLQKIVLYMALGFLIFLLLYFTCRLVFWAWISSSVLGVTQANALSTGSNTVIFGMQISLTESFKNTAPFNLYTFPSLLYHLDQDFSFLSSLVLLYPLSIFSSLILVSLLTKKGFPIPKKTNLKAIIIIGVIIFPLGIAYYYFSIWNNSIFSATQKYWILAFVVIDLILIAILSREVLKIKKFKQPKLLSFKGIKK